MDGSIRVGTHYQLHLFVVTGGVGEIAEVVIAEIKVAVVAHVVHQAAPLLIEVHHRELVTLMQVALIDMSLHDTVLTAFEKVFHRVQLVGLAKVDVVFDFLLAGVFLVNQLVVHVAVEIAVVLEGVRGDFGARGGIHGIHRHIFRTEGTVQPFVKTCRIFQAFKAVVNPKTDGEDGTDRRTAEQ